MEHSTGTREPPSSARVDPMARAAKALEWRECGIGDKQRAESRDHATREPFHRAAQSNNGRATTDRMPCVVEGDGVPDPAIS